MRPATADEITREIGRLLAERPVQPKSIGALLDGAPDERALRDWLRHVDTELTPGRRLAAEATLVRIEIDLDNEWYDAHVRDGSVRRVLEDLHRLRNALADAGG